MALLFCDGFDSYAVTSDLVLGRFNTAGSLVVNTTAGKFGAGAVTLPNFGSIAYGSTKVIPGLSLSNTLFGGFWFKQTGIPTYSLIASSPGGLGFPTSGSAGTLLTAQANTGFIQLGNIGSGSILATGTHFNICDGQWHWIEFQIVFATTATGLAKVWVDGIQEINLSSAITFTSATLNGYANLANMINGNIGSPYVSTYFDDLILWDNTGTSFNTGPIGPQRISTLIPNADGDLTQFTPKTAGAHYAMVNGGYTSTNYVSDTGTGNVDLYKFPSLAYSPASVSAVVASYFAQNPGTGSINMLPVLKTAGTQVSGSGQQLPNGVSVLYSKPWYADASGAAWTPASVNAMQLGVGD